VRSWPKKQASTWNKRRTLGKSASALPFEAVAAGVMNGSYLPEELPLDF
jgi:hypothetical protein